MTITPSQFRGIYSEFADQVAYPETAIAYWLNDAYTNLNAQRWANRLDLGAMLYTAHKITLSKRNADAANKGGTPGQIQGVLSSKGVGPVSAGYDTSGVQSKDAQAEYWNQTQYGLEFWQWAQLVGIGGVQLGGCAIPPFGNLLTGGGINPYNSGG